jgi:GDP-L-fucose synthase
MKLNHIPVVNIGSGIDIEIATLASKVANIVGWNGNLQFDISKPDGMMKKLLDITHLKSIEWVPTVSLGDGITALVKEYINGLAKI